MGFSEKFAAQKQIRQLELELKEVEWHPAQRKLQEITLIIALMMKEHGKDKVFAIKDKKGVSDELASFYLSQIMKVVNE